MDIPSRSIFLTPVEAKKKRIMLLKTILPAWSFTYLTMVIKLIFSTFPKDL